MPSGFYKTPFFPFCKAPVGYVSVYDTMMDR